MALPQEESKFLEHIVKLVDSLVNLKEELTEEIEENENVVEKVTFSQGQQMMATLADDSKNKMLEFMSGSPIKTEQDRNKAIDSLPRDIFEFGVDLTPKIVSFVFNGIGSLFDGLLGMINSMADESGADITKKISRGESSFKELLRGFGSQDDAIQKFFSKLNKNIMPELRQVPFKILSDSKVRKKLEDIMFGRQTVEKLQGNPPLQAAVLTVGSRHLEKFCRTALDLIEVALDHLTASELLRDGIVADGIHDYETGVEKLKIVAARMEDTAVHAILIEGPLLNRYTFNEQAKDNMIVTLNDSIDDIRDDEKLKNLVRALEYTTHFRDDLMRALEKLNECINGAKNNIGFPAASDSSAARNAAVSLSESVSRIKDGASGMQHMLGAITEENQFFDRITALRPMLEQIFSFKHQAEKLELLPAEEYVPDIATQGAFNTFADDLLLTPDTELAQLKVDLQLLDEYFNRAARRENRDGQVISGNFQTVVDRIRDLLLNIKGDIVYNLDLASTYQADHKVSAKTERQVNDMMVTGIDRALVRGMKNFSFVQEALRATGNSELSAELAKGLSKVKAAIDYKLPPGVTDPGANALIPPVFNAVIEEALVTNPDMILKGQKMQKIVDSIEQDLTTIGRSFLSLEAQVKLEVSKKRVRTLVPIVKLIISGRSIIKELGKKDKGRAASNNHGPNPGY